MGMSRTIRHWARAGLVGGAILAGQAVSLASESTPAIEAEKAPAVVISAVEGIADDQIVLLDEDKPAEAALATAVAPGISVIEPVPEGSVPVLRLPPPPPTSPNTPVHPANPTPQPSAPVGPSVPVDPPPAPPSDALPATPTPAPASPVAPAPVAAPPVTAAPGNPCATGCGEAMDYWGRVPVTTPFPRPGYFPIPPTGEGYYTLFDQIHDQPRKAPPKYPYPRFGIIPQSFFDIDWRYLDKPNNTDQDFFDELKRMEIGDELFLLTLGGDFRYRYSFEENSRLLNTGPLANRGKDNHYDAFRVRAYADLMITDWVRVFVEGISATQTFYQLPPLVIDRDKADLLNAFVEVRLGEDGDGGSAWLRLGRQELLYGSQRLISTLDWASTRRTFQGAKAYYRSAELDMDAFVVQPVIPNDDRFDSVDNNQVFAGLWNTFKPSKNQAIDAYYLFLDNTNSATIQVPNAANTGSRPRTVTGATSVHTLGARWFGDQDNWLWDVEGMVQAGGYYGQSLFAQSLTAGIGHRFDECPWTPIVWAFFDHASGTDTPGQGTNQTFNQLFPFGHYYFGFIDVVGRRNINDVNFCLTFWPEKWLQGQIQVHNFYLDSRRDALYNAAGAPIRQDATGRSGRNVGTEVDFLVNVHLSNHSDLLISYSYLSAGEFLRNTATTASGRDNPQALYVQYSFRW